MAARDDVAVAEGVDSQNWRWLAGDGGVDEGGGFAELTEAGRDDGGVDEGSHD